MEEVTVTMSVEAASSAITAIKSRMHDFADIREKHPNAVPMSWMRQYKEALDALNAAVPSQYQQHWVRTTI